jgi:hypothetical protein
MTTSLIPGKGTSSSTNTSSEVIDTPAVGFTWIAGLSGAVTAIIAAVISIGQGLGFNALEAPTPITVALIALVGAGIIGWSIAATGDTLARAYASSHVTRTETGENNQPAIQTAAEKLAQVYAAAHGISTEANTTTTPQGRLVAFPTPLPIKVRGKDAQAVAVLVSGESGKETQKYLVGLPDSQLTWMLNDAISLPAAPPPPTTSAAVPSPSAAPAAPPATQEFYLELAPPLKVKVGAKDGEAIAVQIKSEGDNETQRYLVGLPGAQPVWVNSGAVTMPPSPSPAPDTTTSSA